jgi:release factor glutamine methyltransferase
MTTLAVECRTEGLETLRTLRAVMMESAQFLFGAGIESAQIDAEVLLRRVLGIEKAQLYSIFDEPLSTDRQSQFQEMLLRRAQREPVAYIAGRKEFWSLDFIVTGDVLIPRPETELLVEVGIERLAHFVDKPPHILDLGTGSGVIAVCLAKERLDARIWAVDISAAALEIACTNVKRHGVSDRVHLVQGDLFAALGAEKRGFDLIVSNPPYVRTGEISMLAPEIREWEPMTALDGGVDGMETYHRIIGKAHEYLGPGGHIVLEIGSDLGKTVAGLFTRSGCYGPVSVYQDYAGKDRVIAAVKLPASDPAPKGVNCG